MLITDDTIIDLKPEPPRTSRLVVRPPMDVEPQFAPAPPPPSSKRPPVGRNTWVARISVILMIVGLAAVLGHFGFVLRDSLYEPFRMMRHRGDINNAFNQGYRVNTIARELAAADGVVDANDPKTVVPGKYLYRAWVKRFDDAYNSADERERFDFDYVPLRLLIATLWVRNVQQEFPGADNWQDGFAFTRFMLRINTFLGALTAVGMFMLVRHWVLRAGAPAGPSIVAQAKHGLAKLKSYAWSTLPVKPLIEPLPDLRPRPVIKAWTLGFIAAALVWFEPNILIESHIWPQWDLWIVPFFVLACWLASANWWFAAGLSLGVGAMLKGQMLFGAPLLLLWPIFDARPGAVARLLTGFATSFLGIAAPWLVQTHEAAGVVGMSVAAAAIMVPFFWMRRKAWVFGVISAVAGIAVLTPFLFTRNGNAIALGLLLVGLILTGPWVFAKRSAGVWIMAVACAATALAGVYWGGSPSWWKIGFGYGTRHYETLYMGPSVNNLSAVMADVYRWKIYDTVFSLDVPQWVAQKLTREPGPRQSGAPDLIQDGRLVVTAKLLMTSIYVALLPLCAFAAARHARRNDPRFLVAITAPWVIFFAVMAQMHERYLFWAAVIATCGVGVSLGMTFLWAVVSAMSFGMILQCQLPRDPNAYTHLSQGLDVTLQNAKYVLERAHPGLGWAMMLLAVVYLYLAMTSSRKKPLDISH